MYMYCTPLFSFHVFCAGKPPSAWSGLAGSFGPAVCQEDQVNTIAGRYYPDGPVFACQDGFPHFTDQVRWNESLIQNTAVTCSNLQEDIDLQDDEGMTSPFAL